MALLILPPHTPEHLRVQQAVDMLVAYLLREASGDPASPEDGDARPVHSDGVTAPPPPGLSKPSRSARRNLRPPPEASS